MKLALIARCDNRGLGHLGWDMARALHPDKILVVECVEPIARDFVQHVERFRGEEGQEWEWRVTPWGGGHLADEDIDWLLDDVDLVFSHETFYDERIVPMADRRGVASCLMAMPEFYRADLPRPTAVWLPTSWRADVTPHDAIVPVPVALDRFVEGPPSSTTRTRWLHVAGNRAALDRNGTAQVLAALRRIRKPARVEFAVQRGRLPTPPRRLPVEVVLRGGAPDDYWQLYDGVDALVLPRRYGGLCLPVQEAMAAGLAVVLPDIEPNREWPAVLVDARRSAHLRTAAGLVQTWTTSPASLAQAMDRLVDPLELATARAASRAWAERHSWEALRSVYVRALEALVG